MVKLLRWVYNFFVSFRFHGRKKYEPNHPVLIPEQKAMQCSDADQPGSAILTPLQNARRFAEQEVSLPIHPFLSDEDVERVIDACNGWQV